MNNPKEGALTTMKAVLVLLGYADNDLNWENAKKVLLSTPKILTTVDKEKISKKVMRRVVKLTNQEDFEDPHIHKAAKILRKWVVAIVEHNKLVKENK